MTAPDVTAPVVESEPAAPAATIGWGRAILSGLAVLVVGFVGAVYVPNRILTKALGLTRTARSGSRSARSWSWSSDSHGRCGGCRRGG